MQQPGTDMTKRAEVLAARLRFVYLDTADDGEQGQRSALGETLAAGLASAPADQRDGLLSELVVRLTMMREASGQHSAPPGAVAGGIAPAGSAGPNAESLRRPLTIADGQSVDAASVVALAAITAEFVVSLDQFVWNTWQNMTVDDSARAGSGGSAAGGGQTGLKRPLPLQQSMAKFVAAQPDAPDAAQLRHDLEKLRQLTAAMVAGVVNAGRTFAQKHVERLAPAEIESMVGLSRGLLVSGDAQCWRKYQELAGSMDAAGIEKELQAALVAYVQTLIKGLGR